MRKSMWAMFVVVMVVALGVSGCATKTYVQEQVTAAKQASDAKISEVQKQVESTQMDVTNLKKSDTAQNEELAKLSDTTREAMKRAEEAGKLAKGRLVLEVTLSDENVKFALGKSELTAEYKAALDAFAAKVKDLGKDRRLYIEIQGHTDSIGSDNLNLKLGQQRAETVMRYLNMQQGIPLYSMSAISYGKFKPVADNKAKDGRAKNRRVNLVVLE
jgi:peptidoglycan-associated lipoprotein